MRSLLSLILVLAICNILEAQDYIVTPFSKSYGFRIEGVIRGYRPGDENNFITIRTYNVSGQFNDSSVFIDQHGQFRCNQHQPFEGDIGLIYNNEFITIYARPSEKIYVGIDEQKWKLDPDKNNAISFRGPSASISKGIIDFQDKFYNQKFKNNPDPGDKYQSEEKFAAIRIARMNEELEFLNTYIIRNGIKFEKFLNWCKNDIIYNAGYDITSYCFAGKLNSTITYNQIMNLLNFISVNNNDALNNSMYYDFLKILTSGFLIIANLNPVYIDSIAQKGNSKLLFTIEKIDTYTAGVAKELMYYFISNYKRNEPGFDLSRISSMIKNPYIKELIITSANNIK